MLFIIFDNFRNATLVKSLSEKEGLLAELDIKLNQEMETVRTSVLPIDKLKVGLSIAREMFRKGELSETRQLVALYVDKVLVYKDYVEVYLNALPSMSHLTNIKEFMATVSTDSASIKKLLRTDVNRKNLNVDERRKVIKKATPE